MPGCADECGCTGRGAATVTRRSWSRGPEDHTLRPSVVLAQWFDRPRAALGDCAARSCEGEQHLDHLLQEGGLPRFTDDRSTCCLGRQCYLELCRCCWWVHACAPPRGLAQSASRCPFLS